MGREIKRVALDFDWPLHKVWKGYVNPYYKECPDCRRGYTVSREALSQIVRLLMIGGEDSAVRPRDFQPSERQQTIPWGNRNGSRYYPHPRLLEAEILDPGPDLHEVSGGLAERPPRLPFGHDSMDCWRAEEKIIKAAGLDPEKWGICPTCNGSAEDPATKEAADDWKEEEPPAGEGWQVWETISEGSPVSPVFRSREELVRYLVDNGYSLEAAESFSTGGWAPSMLVISKGDEKQCFRDIESCRVMDKSKG